MGFLLCRWLGVLFQSPMQFVKIPKGHGKFRTICVPTPEEKIANRLWIPRLNGLLKLAWLTYPQNENPIHGFVEGRSPVTNAMVHRGWKFTLTMDLKDFFDTVGFKHVVRYLSHADWDRFTADCLFVNKPDIGILQPMKCAVQGMPASPFIANLAASQMDKDILELVTTGRCGKSFVYTRYCDDLTFSFDTPDVGIMLKREVHRIAAIHGFEINQAKTKLQCAASGRRIITGVSVDNDIRMTRETRRRIRAARHQIRTRITGRNRARIASIARERKAKGDTASMHGLLVSGYRGLLEWSRMRLPKEFVKQSKQTTAKVTTQKLVVTTQARRASWQLTESTRSFV